MPEVREEACLPGYVHDKPLQPETAEPAALRLPVKTPEGQRPDAPAGPPQGSERWAVQKLYRDPGTGRPVVFLPAL